MNRLTVHHLEREYISASALWGLYLSVYGCEPRHSSAARGSAVLTDRLMNSLHQRVLRNWSHSRISGTQRAPPGVAAHSPWSASTIACLASRDNFCLPRTAGRWLLLGPPVPLGSGHRLPVWQRRCDVCAAAGMNSKAAHVVRNDAISRTMRFSRQPA